MAQFLNILVLLLSCTLALSTDDHGHHEKCQFGIDAAKRSAGASNDFGWKIFAKVKKPEENLVFSPVSITLALALVESGTGGATRQELQSHLAPAGSNEADSSKLYESLQRQLQIKGGDQVTLNIANGFFHTQELNVKPEFLNHTKQCFETQVEKVQFKTNAEEARRHINQWVSDKTNQKIPELFKPRTIDAQTVAAIANALYLKAAWSNPFRQTESLPFYKLGGDQTQSVTFMSLEKRLPYAENDKMQVVELPYEGSLSMYVILPKQRGGLTAMESLAKEEYRALFANITTRKVDVKIPKFTVRSSINLKDVLVQLGINKIFSDQADFSRLSDQRLKVSSAVHEAFIKINENGTEAAAATGFGITLMSLPPPETAVQFKADHPFVFTIVHKPTKATVFAGRVVKVDQE